jgi:hypothetical protein
LVIFIFAIVIYFSPGKVHRILFWRGGGGGRRGGMKAKSRRALRPQMPPRPIFIPPLLLVGYLGVQRTVPVTD